MESSDYETLLLHEFAELKNTTKKACYRYDFLLPHQEFVRRYMSRFYNNDRVLMQHTTGSGKTLTAVAVCEDMRGINNKCLVLVKGNLSAENFRQKVLEFHKLANSSLSPAEILSYYEIDNFIRFSRNAAICSDVVELYSNRIIVIDEVHNIRHNRGDKSTMEPTDELLNETSNRDLIANIYTERRAYDHTYPVIRKFLNSLHNTKVLLLSATPIFDKPSEFLAIIGLLIKDADDVCKANNIRDMDLATDENVVDILRKIAPRGLGARISYYNKHTFMPKMNFVGVRKHGKIDYGREVVISKFGADQQQLWDNIANGNTSTADHIFLQRSYISIFACNNMTGKPLANALLERHPEKDSICFESGMAREARVPQLERYACKINKILESFNEKSGLIYIYCQYIRGSGLLLLAAALEANGYRRYADPRKPLTEHGKRYILCTGDTKQSPDNFELLRAFNQKSNERGEKIQVLIGSSVVSECITIKRTRQIHILTPHWNDSLIMQAIGRIVRTHSHADLPVSEQCVDVFMHMAVSNTDADDLIDYSADGYRLNIANKKRKVTHAIYDFIQSISIDCYLNSPEKMDPDIRQYLSKPLTSRITFNKYHVPEMAPLLHSYLVQAFRGNTMPVTVESVIRKFNADAETVRACIEYMRHDIRFMFTKPTGSVYTLFISHGGFFVFTQSVDERALTDFEHQYEPQLASKHNYFIRDPPAIPLAIIKEKTISLNDAYDSISPQRRNIFIYTTCEDLMKWSNINLTALFEYAFIAYPKYRSFYKRIFFIHIYTLDGILYHTLKYRRKEYSQASYAESATRIQPLGYTRQYCPSEKKWEDITVMNGRFANVERVLDIQLQQKYKNLDTMMGIYLRLCPKDETIRIRKTSQTTDKRFCPRGHQIKSIRRSEYLQHVEYIVTSVPIVDLVLCDLYKTSPINTIPLHCASMSRFDLKSQCIIWLAYCGLFVLS